MSDRSWIKRTDDEQGDGQGIVTLELARAPVNALDAAGLMGLRDVMTEISSDDTVRAVILTSAFATFSAGLNLKQAQHFDRDAQRAIVTGLNEGFMALFACPKPVICAVGGAAIAGGLFFVLAADHRIAVPRAQFGLAEVRVGVGFPAGPLGIARASVDATTARRLMMRGQPMDAQAALAAGVIDQIVEPDALLEAARAAATEFAQLPPRAYATVKDQLRGDAVARIRADIDAETQAGDDWFTDETAAAMARMIG